MDRLNYFRPYESKGAGHEDQLTRAFLVVVRMVPLALSAFLDLVREYQISRHVARLLPSFSEVTVQPFSPSTQKAAIPQTTGRLISIIMTDEHSVRLRKLTEVYGRERKPEDNA